MKVKLGLRARREALGLGRERFARTVKPEPVSASLIGQMESGYVPGPEVAQRVANAAGCTVAQMYEPAGS